jgi:ribosomal protein S18 acetylase RimI-like enzyme
VTVDLGAFAAMRIRVATPDDAAALLAVMTEGFEGYGSFAPEDWEPEMPTVEQVAGRVGAPTTFCLIAEDDGGGAAGHVGFLPSDVAGHPDAEPGLAHLWQLFVRPPHWGTGLAADLLARAVAEAHARGFTTMRLYTPAGQSRARRFYEREGFALAGGRLDERLGLEIVEYRRAL